MEGTLQQETQESEYKNTNEDQGGIRQRLRDRDLLKKRKAEAEEKETNQWVLGVESPRKRAKADQKSSARKRGRPRKTDSTLEISFTQEEAAQVQEAPAGVGVSDSVELLPAQTSGSLTSVGKDTLEPVLAAPPAPLPDLTFVQSPILAPTLTSLTSTASVLAPTPAIILDTASVPAQDLFPALAPTPDVVLASPLSQTPAPVVPVPPPIGSPQVETISTESEGKKASDPLVLIEDVGPDEEEDLSRNKEKSTDEDISETSSNSVPEQNKIFSVPSLSALPAPQGYLPGNSF